MKKNIVPKDLSQTKRGKQRIKVNKDKQLDQIKSSLDFKNLDSDQKNIFGNSKKEKIL